MSAPVELSGVAKRYGGQIAVEAVSLTVAAGEFVSLLGPSGSGKTTTLMMIAGFAAPDAGAIRIGDENVTHVPPYRRNIGMVHQGYALFPHMSVAKNIGFPLRMRGLTRDAIAEKVGRALALVQLDGLEARLPNQLSGGQQQRVALARALVFEPPLLLMDEPLGALDRKLREELQVEIKRIQRETRSTVIYVTHDQDEALSLSDRIAVMNRGRIEQIGAPSALYEQPRTRFVADFLGASNFLEAVVTAADQLRTDRGAEIAVAPRAPHDIGRRVIVSVRPERIRLAAAGDGHAARVLDVAYHGTAQRYLLELAGGDRLTALRPNLGEPAIQAGSAVIASWAPGDAWVIPEG